MKYFIPLKPFQGASDQDQYTVISDLYLYGPYADREATISAIQRLFPEARVKDFLIVEGEMLHL